MSDQFFAGQVKTLEDFAVWLRRQRIVYVAAGVPKRPAKGGWGERVLGTAYEIILRREFRGFGPFQPITTETEEDVDQKLLGLELAVQERLQPQATAESPATVPGNDPTLAILRVFTGGIADDRITKAARLLADNKLTVSEKLAEIDALIPLPATASAEQLGEMLGVTKQAVWKTDWWAWDRKGEKENEIGRRREIHRSRAKSYEPPGQGDDDE